MKHRRYYLAGLALLTAALVLGLVSAEVRYSPWSAERCFNTCGLIQVYTIWEGVALKSGVNVTVYNMGDEPVYVNGSILEPNSSRNMGTALVLRVDGGRCLVCIRVEGLRVETPLALLSIPAAALSVVGFALVLYSMAARALGA